MLLFSLFKGGGGEAFKEKALQWKVWKGLPLHYGFEASLHRLLILQL